MERRARFGSALSPETPSKNDDSEPVDMTEKKYTCNMSRSNADNAADVTYRLGNNLRKRRSQGKGLS